MAERLSISLVVYQPDTQLLLRTLQTLRQAADAAQLAGLLAEYCLTLVDNTHYSANIRQPPYWPQVTAVWQPHALRLFMPGNIGYGAGHNLAITNRCAAFHLVLNPDVLLDIRALSQCVQTLQQQPKVGFITPRCYRPDGQQEYLCKNYPSVWTLLLRGFAPNSIKRYFARQLHAYEVRSTDLENRYDISIASGCFMFFRRTALQQIAGFNAAFFLYFEDFDLSLRLKKQWQIAYVPSVKITHYGGHSAKKGWQHIIWFIRSGWLFFNHHGWRFW